MSFSYSIKFTDICIGVRNVRNDGGWQIPNY